MLHSVDQSPYVSDCALQTKFLKKVQKGDHIFVHSKSRLCPSLSCFSLSVYSLPGIFCHCERIVKKRLKLWYPIYFVFYQNRGVQPFCYCRPPGPQPTDIFGGGAKWCNLLLHLTNTHVCENFGGAIARYSPSGCGPAGRITFIYMKYGHQWVRVIFMRYCQVPTNTEHIQTLIAYSFYNSLWHHQPDCYASRRLIFLPFCFASMYASTAAKSYILSYMWTAANFIIEGRMRRYGCRLCTVVSEYGLHITGKHRVSDFSCFLVISQLILHRHWSRAPWDLRLCTGKVMYIWRRP